MIIFDPYFTPKRKTNSTWIRNLNVNRGITQVVLDGNSGEFSLMLGCTDACILSCVRLFLTLWSVARQAPLPMGILQARILGWVATPSSRGSSPPRDGTHTSSTSCTADGFFTHWATWEAPFPYLTISLQTALPLSWWSCGTSVRSNPLIPLWGHALPTYPQSPGAGEEQTCFLLLPVWTPPPAHQVWLLRCWMWTVFP